MTAGRKPTQFVAQEKPVIDAEAVRADLVATEEMGKAIRGYGQGRDLVNQILGQAQAFQAAGDLLRTFGVSKLAIVKENKLYQQLAGSAAPNGSELKGTWVEFCNLLGVSDDKANQDIANLQAFGEEALEQMQRVGIGYRDLRQFRKLPADQRTALIEAAKEGDKNTLLDLAEDLIAKHQREKESITKKLEDSESSLAASRQVVGQKEATISKLQESLAARSAKAPTPAFIADAALRDLDNEALRIAGMIEASLRSYLVKISSPDLAIGDVLRRQSIIGAVGRVQAAARQLAQDFDVPVTGAEAADGCGEMDAEWAATLRDIEAAEGNGHVAKD